MGHRLAGDPPEPLPSDEAFWEKFEARAPPAAPPPRAYPLRHRAHGEQKGELIGRGHFAQVRIARNLSDGRCASSPPRAPLSTPTRPRGGGHRRYVAAKVVNKTKVTGSGEGADAEADCLVEYEALLR